MAQTKLGFSKSRKAGLRKALLPNRKDDIVNYNCNICEKEISEQDPNIEINEALGYGSSYDEEIHHVRWCADCFANLLDTCKRQTQVAVFTEIDKQKYENSDFHPWKDKLPGEFCTVCDEGLVLLDFNDNLVIQVELDNIEHEVRFCNKCFDKVIDNCKQNSFVRTY